MNNSDEDTFLIAILAVLGFMVFSIKAKAATGSVTVGPLGPTLNVDGTPFIPGAAVATAADQNFGVDPIGW